MSKGVFVFCFAGVSCTFPCVYSNDGDNGSVPTGSKS